MKKRKKSTILEERQVPHVEDSENITDYVNKCIEIAEWCNGKSFMMNPYDESHLNHILVPTVNGDIKASPRDYIAQMVDGKFYIRHPDIFNWFTKRCKLHSS